MTTYERGAEADAETGGEDFMSTCINAGRD